MKLKQYSRLHYKSNRLFDCDRCFRMDLPKVTFTTPNNLMFFILFVNLYFKVSTYRFVLVFSAGDDLCVSSTFKFAPYEQGLYNVKCDGASNSKKVCSLNLHKFKNILLGLSKKIYLIGKGNAIPDTNSCGFINISVCRLQENVYDGQIFSLIAWKIT